ncbi:MAG: cytochrome c biogenesis CcdA family protein [Ramlibacter sp.]
MNEPLLAALAGVLTIAAPCVLPMLPVVLGASIGQTSRWRPAFIALGFAITFCVVGLLFNAATQAAGLSQEVLRDAAAAMLLAFGLLMLWPRPFEWLGMRLNGLVNRVHAVGDRAGSGNAGGFVLGMTLGAVWTPCAGPVLGSILTLVAASADPGRAALLLACYSTGAAVPMLGIAYGGQFASTRVRSLARHAHRLQQGFGVLVMLVALAMYFQVDTLVTVWLSNLYPQARMGL